MCNWNSPRLALISAAVILGCSGTDNTSPPASFGGTTAVGGGGASVGGQLSAGGMAAQGGSLANAGGAGGNQATGGSPGVGGTASSCTSPTVRITEFDVGATYQNNETDGGLLPLALSPIPSGGTRFAWMGTDSMVHITTLNADDTVNTSVPAVTLSANDFDDVFADNNGGVVLLSRNAKGGGTLNCGTPSNLCGTPPSPAIPCYDEYMVRFDGTAETWATELTQSSAAHPPYLNSATDATNVIFIWWYMHEGRITTDGTNYAAYYGAAISVTQSGCVNIHQGDEMRVVSPAGAMLTGHNSFDWGCSHSGYERIVWDGSKFVMVCKNDAPTGGKSGQIAFAPNITTIYPIDLYYDAMGDIVTGAGGGYWLTASDIRTGQTANTDGLADTHLLHFTTGAPDQNIMLASVTGTNDRAPHLAKYGSNMLAAWEQATAVGDLAYKSTGRTMYLQVLNNSTGAAISTPITVPSGTAANAVYGNRYQSFKTFPDGSVAYPSAGSTGTKLKVLRIMPCQ